MTTKASRMFLHTPITSELRARLKAAAAADRRSVAVYLCMHLERTLPPLATPVAAPTPRPAAAPTKPPLVPQRVTTLDEDFEAISKCMTYTELVDHCQKCCNRPDADEAYKACVRDAFTARDAELHT